MSLGQSSSGRWRSRGRQAQGLGPWAHAEAQGCPHSKAGLQQLTLLSPPMTSSTFSLRSLLNGLLRRTCLPSLLSCFPVTSALFFPRCLTLPPLSWCQDRAHRAFATCDQTALWPGTALLCLLPFSRQISALPHRRQGVQ